ncbi:hypothetical protein [Nostoc sp.]|uniref:hypothetical protein n=1 Tax=Nostoc sp. TaxID=1180 RepID=UPI002FFB986E
MQPEQISGQIVRVRSRQYLVEEVVSKLSPEQDTKVSLSCLEDDALGESLEVQCMQMANIDPRF